MICSQSQTMILINTNVLLTHSINSQNTHPPIPTSPHLSPTHVNSSIFTSPGLNTSYSSRVKSRQLDQTLLTPSKNYLKPIRS